MGWVWWLLAPVLVTSVVAVITWLAGRPRRPPTSEEAVGSHRRFLADLADASAPAHRARFTAGPASTAPTSTASASTSPASTAPDSTAPDSTSPARAGRSGDHAGPDTLPG